MVEKNGLNEAGSDKVQWKKWGSYLSERQWGTVREKYSENGDAWNFFTHDHARSRACRWGEDGIEGISDDKQRLCFALALWNGKDAILKERLFGLTNSQGNGQRSRDEMDYKLLDTGVFDEDRYFDVFVENANAGPEDIPVKINAINRADKKPVVRKIKSSKGVSALSASHPMLGDFVFSCKGEFPLLFTETETNHELLSPGQKNESQHVKDGMRFTKDNSEIKDSVFGKSFNKAFAERIKEANAFYKSIFNKLLVNYTWWVNRKDRFGKYVFKGGFLGLDNIGIFDRMICIYTRDEKSKRPVYEGSERFQVGPNWCDYILFYEYYHGDNGAGLGASHQTGWSGVVAKLIQLYGILDSENLLEIGKKAAFIESAKISAKEKK